MSKRATIAGLTRITSHVDVSEHAILRCEAVVKLAQHISVAIRSCPDGRKHKVSCSGCTQVALQILLVAAGLRRAALVDAVGLTAAQASAVSLKLASVSRQEKLPDREDLAQVRLLHHAPTSQTFIVSRRQSLWADVAALTSGASSGQSFPVVWIDARSTPEHAAPTLAVPDAHAVSLIVAVGEAIARDDSQDVLIASPSIAGEALCQSPDEAEAQLVGVALAGFLLEYGAIYFLHNPATRDAARQYRYHVGPPKKVSGNLVGADFAVASPANSLACQPLMLCKVFWRDHASCLELVSFSIPDCLCTAKHIEHLCQALTTTFHSRLDGTTHLFRSGSISVEMASVTLHQVAL